MSDVPSFAVVPAPVSSAPARVDADVLGRLDALRGELVELAFTMEQRGRIDAADVASGTAARLGELCAEFDPSATGVPILSKK